MSPLIAVIAVLCLALLVLGVLWLLGPWKAGSRQGSERTRYRPSSVHRWGHEERTRDLR